MAYAYIEGDVIKEIVDILPVSWRNISGLHLSKDDDEFLNSLGWYRVVRQEVSYNNETQRVSSYDYEINDNYISEIPIISDLPQNEIVTFEMKKEFFMIQLRGIRNQLLKDSDWTQFPDVIESKSEQYTTEWRQYRQSLRDIPEEYWTNQIVSIDQVIWPELPLIKY